MSTVNVRIPDQLNNQLISIAKTLHLPKSHLIRQAIQEYMRELEEDARDIAIVEKILANSTGETYSWEEVQRECGLLDD